MTNTELLISVINDSGYKRKYIADALGITTFGLLKKLRNETEFKASEIRILSRLFNLTNDLRDEIFFAEKVE